MAVLTDVYWRLLWWIKSGVQKLEFFCVTLVYSTLYIIFWREIHIYKYIYITKTRIYDLIVLEGWMLGFCKRCAGFIETIKPSHLQAPATQVQSHRPSSQLSHVHNHSFITTNINQVHNHHPNSRTSLQYHSHFSNFKGIPEPICIGWRRCANVIFPG